MSDKYFAIRNSRMAARLAELTRFSRVEIVALLRMYQQIGEVYKMPMNKQVFVEILSNLFDITDDIVCAHVFVVANFSSSGRITEDEWVFLMEIFLIGNFEERVRFAFSVYDLERTGELTRPVLAEFVSRGVRATSSVGDDVENMTKDIVDLMFSVYDLKRDNSIDFEEFKEVCEKEPLLMETIGQCLPDQRHVLVMLALFEGREKHTMFYYTDNPDTS